MFYRHSLITLIINGFAICSIYHRIFMLLPFITLIIWLWLKDGYKKSAVLHKIILSSCLLVAITIYLIEKEVFTNNSGIWMIFLTFLSSFLGVIAIKENGDIQSMTKMYMLLICVILGGTMKSLFGFKTTLPIFIISSAIALLVSKKKLKSRIISLSLVCISVGLSLSSCPREVLYLLNFIVGCYFWFLLESLKSYKFGEKQNTYDPIHTSYLIFILTIPTVLTSNIVNSTTTNGLQLFLFIFILSIFVNARQTKLNGQHFNWLCLQFTTLSLGFLCLQRNLLSNITNNHLREKFIINEIVAILTPFMYIISRILLK